MNGRDRKNKKVAIGATLSSKSGPQVYKSNKTAEKKRKKTRKKRAEIQYQPMLVRGKDIENLDVVLRFLRKSGIPVDGYKHAYLIRRTRSRMGRLKLDTYREYFQYLTKTPGELKALQEALSINVTRFFRNSDTYTLIKDQVLPAIIKQVDKKRSNQVKIWSAGCAVGAEPYSMAMFCSNEKFKKYSFNILATDINEDLLDLAKNGIYSPQYLAEMMKKEADKFFTKNTDGNYQIKRKVQKLVKFELLDLTSSKYPTNIDLILCRNVLIYIDKAMQETIIDQFYRALKTEGFIVLGRTETLWGQWKGKFEIISAKHRIYKKI